jgi:uncharacterized protein (TIGR02246 family)
MPITSIQQLHSELLEAWNRRDANGMAALFSEKAVAVGFDGTVMTGKQAIAAAMTSIFASHSTSKYVWKVRDIRMLAQGFALLNAVAGMVPPGKHVIKPDVNAIQTLLAAKDEQGWSIELFQNTPARFDGRPEAADALTAELNAIVGNSSPGK